MPGEISRSSPGLKGHHPYVPSWCYENSNPPMCSCGCHHGYHDDNGICINKNHYKKCGCVKYDGKQVD